MAVIALARPVTQTHPADDQSCAPESRPRLRVGLFAASRMQPRALVEALAEIARSEFAEIVLLTVGKQPAPEIPLVWRAYRWLDQRVFFRGKTSAPDFADLNALPGSARMLEIPERSTGLSSVNRWHSEVVALRLDVALMLDDFADQAIASAAKYGLWRFTFGMQGDPGDGLEGFREVANGQPITIARLKATLPGDDERVLYESRSRTSPFSVTRNRDRLLHRVAQFPGRVLKELHRSRAASPGQPLPNHSQAPMPDPGMTRSLLSIGERAFWRGLQKLSCVDQWFIAYRFGSDGGETPLLGEFRCLMPPKDRFWADPFPLERDGRHYIFFEELIFAEGKAHIAVVEVDRDGHCSPPQRVLERPYHLSYPFLIEAEGQLFMVPETGENHSVELYRCIHFPDRWVLEKVLLQAPCCVDATFHYTDDRWWMFVNIGANDADVHDELHLYYADSLCGEWLPHRQNPVKSDVRSARPAGRLFEHGRQLYRPAQIGAPLYGSGMSINRVLKLTPEAFIEEEVGRILPQRAGDFLGVHTLNRAGYLSVVDGFVRRRRFGSKRYDTFEPEYLRPGFITENG